MAEMGTISIVGSSGMVAAKPPGYFGFFAKAKARVSTFLESLGLRPLDVGNLQMAQHSKRSVS